MKKSRQSRCSPGTMFFPAARRRVRCLVILLCLCLQFPGARRGFAAIDQDTTATAPSFSLSLMPLPSSVHPGTGSLLLDSHFRAGFSAFHDTRLDAAADRMLNRLNQQCGNILRAQNTTTAADPMVLAIQVKGPGDRVQGIDEDESYQLNVTPTQATITAATDVGAMHGMETFLQLVTMTDASCRVAVVHIDDAPRFRWRGFQLDVARHFIPVAVIQRTLDGMAVAKLNVFHWSLTGDQAFRAESKVFPRLTGVASHGLFYTQDQMREVVAYARARGIRVVPEFDMPGHSTSWVLAYPEIGDGRKVARLPMDYGANPAAELDPTKEATYRFIDAFLGEMSTIFPDAYLHIGGDEVRGLGWASNPDIQAFMKKNGFQSNADLQAYFNKRVLQIVTKHGKKMLGWELELPVQTSGTPENITLQSWHDENSATNLASEGYATIVSSPYELYYLDQQKTAEEMFLADPIPANSALTLQQERLILGGEVCMWGEFINAETIDSRVWPNTMALAERFWSPRSDRDVAEMYRRLWNVSLELDAIGLTHLSGPERLRRHIFGSAHPEALDTLASVTKPAGFMELWKHPIDEYSPLNDMVDAVVADPPMRWQIAMETDSVVSGKPGMTDAKAALRKHFEEWQHAAPMLIAWAPRANCLSNIEQRARQLGTLAEVGLESLAYLDSHTSPPGLWLAHQQDIINEAKKPSALIYFVFLPDLEKLLHAAAASPHAQQ